ncbi:MAG: hypothetical protein MJ245_02530 [Clostridia bacterium]|nr:hypothetical protein [Clostridia bacterium]
MKSITKSENGTYRWYYEFDMLKNPMVIRTVFKIFFYILLGLCTFLILLDIIEGNFGVTSLIETTKAMGITAGILFGLSIISYFILAGIYGFKYCVLFEMNDEGIKHIQMEKQFKKAKALAWVEAITGMVSGNATLAGSGLLAGTKNQLTTDFGRVKKVKVIKKHNTIKIVAPFSHNQIYVCDEDFDFVLNYINERTKK